MGKASLVLGSLVLLACSGSTVEVAEVPGDDAGLGDAAGSGGEQTGGAGGQAVGGGHAVGGSGGQAVGGSGGQAVGGSGGEQIGGAAGESSGGGAGQGGGSSASAECTKDSDCALLSDCCECRAYVVGEAVAECSLPCTVNTCVSMGLPFTHEAKCIAGQCAVGFNCNPSDALCDSLPPECKPGMSNSVRNGCWGPCVPASDCESVPSCKDCDPNGFLCISNDAHTSTKHCVAIPPACEKQRTCSCLGDAVCIGAFDICIDGAPGSNEIHCGCPSC